MLKIVKYPHPALRFDSAPLAQIDEALRNTVLEMFELMYEARGIGLAANQVGLPLRFFILNITADRDQRDQEQVFINPEIVKRHASAEEEEGCLSLPGLYAKVQRARKVKVRAYDLQGNLVETDADELLARAIQHETDHLSGRLFIDLLHPHPKPAVDKLKEFEAEYRQAQAAGEIPGDATIVRQLEEMAGKQRIE